MTQSSSLQSFLRHTIYENPKSDFCTSYHGPKLNALLHFYKAIHLAASQETIWKHRGKKWKLRTLLNKHEEWIRKTEKRIL